MESLVDTSSTMPVKGHKLVDPKKLMELMDQLRLAIPQDIKAAQELILRKDGLIQQAQSEAKRTRIRADEEYKAKLEDNELMSAARIKADSLVEDADKRAKRIVEHAEAEVSSKRNDADAYCLQRLESLEVELNNIIGSVRKGKNVLAPPQEVGVN